MGEIPQVFEARSVVKPWGSEQVFAEHAGLYVGKIIRVTAGEALSLQFHQRKIETIFVIQGSALVEFGDQLETLQSRQLDVGEAIHIPAKSLHRITAIDDLVLAEVSTAYDGWEIDVERLEDRYGRRGISTP